MSTFRNPVGPQPTNVYWRRRLIVGLGVVAVIVVILLIVFAPRGGTPTASTTTKPPATGSETIVGGVAVGCLEGDLAVEAVTDRASYSADQLPMISVTITNTGTVPCEVDAGSDVQVYTITSGDETIWKSSDCQSEPESTTTELAAGESVESTPFEWDRTRSSTKTCDDESPSKVTAKGASYHVSVSVDGVKAAKTRQIILN